MIRLVSRSGVGFSKSKFRSVAKDVPLAVGAEDWRSCSLARPGARRYDGDGNVHIHRRGGERGTGLLGKHCQGSLHIRRLRTA